MSPRLDAILHLICTSDSLAMQMCVGVGEIRELERETHEALLALGVTWEEIARATKGEGES